MTKDYYNQFVRSVSSERLHFKLINKMRLTCLSLCLSIGLTYASSSYAQSVPISLNITNQTVADVLETIEKQSEFNFFYNGKLVDVERKVSINAQEKDIHALLGQLFDATNVSYRIVDKDVILTVGKEQELNQKKKLITGTVVDQNNIPIIGANIVEIGASNGTVSDIDGNFSLSITEKKTLKISYIGYLTKEVLVSNKSKYHIILNEDSKALSEVVVVGYGVVKKRDLTGAISTIKTDEMGLAGMSSIGHAMAGKAAGLHVRQNSAQPGGGLDILVRGAGSINASNDPLYIVDGFPIAKLDGLSGGDQKMNPGTQGILNFLNPNDVESIEVLKDASATSIYGARAANGVVIVTTKRGKKGKAKVNYSYNFSHQKYADSYDMLSLPEWMNEKNNSTWELWVWNNKIGPWGNRTLEEALISPVNGIKYSRYYDKKQVKLQFS